MRHLEYKVLFVTSLILFFNSFLFAKDVKEESIDDAISLLDSGKLEQAQRLFITLAKSGDEAAQYFLGMSYADGSDGFTLDLKKSLKWYIKSAERGLVEAQYNLAHIYRLGKGVKKDTIKATQWYKKASEQGYAPAQHSLAISYNYGEGVKVDLHEALKWYTKSAENGYSNAQNNLGLFYIDGQAGLKVDKKKAFKWFEKSAIQGNLDGMYNLSESYIKGDGVKTSLAQAHYWMKKSADNDSAIAQFRLGLAYVVGEWKFLEVDSKNDMPEAPVEEGLKLLRKSAAQDYQEAIEVLKLIKEEKNKKKTTTSR